MKANRENPGNKKFDMPLIRYLTDINVKSPDDEVNCGITGCVVMPNGRLIVTDFDNEKLKVIDIEHNELVDEMTLPSGPTDVTRLGDNQIVVALPDECKLVLVDTEPELIVQREIDMSGKCWGVSHYNDKLVVALQEPDTIEIVNIDGEVLNTIGSNGDDTKLCDPECTSVSPNGDFIYVSNYGNESIVKLDWDGTVIARYSDKGMKYPGNVVFADADTMLVCGYMSNTLHVISQDGDVAGELLGKSDGLDKPASLAYDRATERLYIGMKANAVKVFQLSSG